MSGAFSAANVTSWRGFGNTPRLVERRRLTMPEMQEKGEVVSAKNRCQVAADSIYKHGLAI